VNAVSKCAVALCLLLLGCTPDAAIEMASIERIAPSVVEQGDVLRIEGAGFVEGPARVTLSGEFDPSGLVPKEHRVVVVDGIAVTETSIEVPISQVAMAALAAEALRFEGRVTVEFPTALATGPSHIAATSAPLTLDVRPAGSGVASTARRAREAEQVLLRLGLSLVPTREGNDLLVGAVTSGGAADKVGISPGDRLLAVDGVALSAPSDLAGLGRDDLHRFELVSSTGRSQVIDLKLAPLDPDAADEVAAILLTAIALGLFLAFAAPRRAPNAEALAPRAVPLADALSFVAVAVPAIALPAISVLANYRLLATALLFGGATAGLVLYVLFGSGEARGRVASFSASLVALVAVPSLALAFGTAFDVAGAVVDQSHTRWGFCAWRSPFAFAAYLAAVALLWPSMRPSERTAPIARLGAWAAGVFSAMAVAAYGLGGWLVPWAAPESLGSDGSLLLVGMALYALKTWTVLLVARSFSQAVAAERRRKGSSQKRALFALAGLALAFFASLFWEWAHLPSEVLSAFRILSAGLFFAFAAAFLSRLAFTRFSMRRTHSSAEVGAPSS
jgi:hypothetical protein